MSQSSVSQAPVSQAPVFQGFQIGHAQDETVRTGVTVILPDAPARAAVDVRGGGPGTRETDTLSHGNLIERVHAVVLSGGSVYGLAAADAVCAALGAKGVGYRVSPDTAIPVSPIVPAAILFDNGNGGDKRWGANPPFARLGRDALEALSTTSSEGRIGAGFGATAGRHAGGFGVATEDCAVGRVTALIAANPVGSPFLPGTTVPHAWMLERNGEFGGARPPADYAWTPPTDTKLPGFEGAASGGVGQSTVIGAIITDVDLNQNDLRRLAVMAQDGLALAVQPSHTPLDGDTIFALSVGAGEGAVDRCAPVDLTALGFAAARAVARALTRGVIKADAAR